MAKRSAMVITLVMLAISASPKEKKEIVPALILRAQYVAVIVDPEAGISVANPGENGIARSDVEAALEKWGRFKLTVNPENADLVVVVRKGGKAIKPTIGGIGNGPPVVWNPGSTGDVTIGVGRTSPPYSNPADPRANQRPTARTEVGFPESPAVGTTESASKSRLAVELFASRAPKRRGTTWTRGGGTLA